MMKDHIERWDRCLQLIREYLPKDVKVIPADDAEWVYSTWFASITCESYDADTGALVLCVPDSHVIDYIEHYRMPLWSWALRTAFSPAVRLSYRVRSAAASSPWFLASAMPHERLRLTVPDARERLEAELLRTVGPGYQWLRCPSQKGDLGYDKIVSWLSDNKGRGLLYVGTPGVGKSVMCCQILPAIIGGDDRGSIPVVTAEQMLQRGDELKRARCVVIDGLGREPRKQYGKTDNTFLDLCEASVQGGPLLIITTCLSTTPVNSPLFSDSIQERYGMEVLDRLASCTTMTRYSGATLRR